MNNPLTSLHEALVYQLEGLYDAEKKMEKAMPICSHKVTSPALRVAIVKYGEQASDKRTKLKGAFGYMGCGRFGRKNHVIGELLKDMLKLCGDTSPERIRDAMALASMKIINKYKIAKYETGLSFAVELQLDNVSDLLHEIIELEMETDRALGAIGMDQINIKEKSASNQLES